MGFRRAFNNNFPLTLLKAPTNTEMPVLSLQKLLSVKQKLYYSCIIKLIIKGVPPAPPPHTFFFLFFFSPLKSRILVQHGFREFMVPS